LPHIFDNIRGDNLATALKQTLNGAKRADFCIEYFNLRSWDLLIDSYVEFLQPLVAEISWTKHITIMSKYKDNQERYFYIMATKNFGCSKNVLTHQIENKTYEKYTNVRSFLLEMDSQFTFIRNQYKIKLGDKEYFKE
jgi:predicted nuclease of restriction endonuclease-like (RecB) superfamily